MMSSLNLKLYQSAMADAKIIMGKDHHRGRGERGPISWRADDDPLAWWCLTELLVSYAQGRKS
jgi:hypothetical protein